MILSEFGSTGIEDTPVFQALSAGNGMNPFRSAPRPVSIPPHVPLCARLSFERDGKTLGKAAINKVNATFRNRGQTTALFRFVAIKIWITRRSTVFIAKHTPVSNILPPDHRAVRRTVPRRGTPRATDLMRVYGEVGKVIGLAPASSIGKAGVMLVFSKRFEIRAH
jgi:hypothetical protein